MQLRGAAELRRRLDGFELSARLGLNQLSWHHRAGYSLAPLAASLDVSSITTKPSALMFRMGLHQVCVCVGGGGGQVTTK